MAQQRRDLAKAAYWRGVLQHYAASGLSVRGFCRREALSEANFYAWRRTLAARDNQHAARDQPGAASDPAPTAPDQQLGERVGALGVPTPPQAHARSAFGE